MPSTKKCRSCKRVKPITEFTRQANAPDGLQYSCKSCHKIRAAKYYQKNKDRIRAVNKSWQDAHPDYLSRPQSRTQEQNHARYLKDREGYKRRSQQWRERNRDKDSEGSRRWQRENPVAKRAIKHQRRARKQANGGSYTVQEWNELCARYDHRCLCCGEHKPLTVDHVLPLSLGGDNTINNLQPLCLACNVRKHAKHIDYRPY